MVVVSDTSPISNLIQIGKLHVLQHLFGEIIIPSYVNEEVKRLSEFGYNLKEYQNTSRIKI